MFCPVLFTQKILERLQEKKKDLHGSLFFLTLYQNKPFLIELPWMTASNCLFQGSI